MTYQAGAIGQPTRRGSEVLVALLQGFWLALLGLVLGAGTGLLVSELTPPSYQAKTNLMVTPISGGTSADARLSNYTRAYSELVTVPEVVGEAVRKNGADPQQIRRYINVEVSPADSPLFEVTASSNEPERAAELANSVGSAVASFTEGLSKNSGYRAEVVANATPPRDPAWPNTALNAAAGATTGLLVGGAAALAWGGRSRRAERTKQDPDEKPGAAAASEAGPIASGQDPESLQAKETAVGETVTEKPPTEEPEAPKRVTEEDAGGGSDFWFGRLRRAGLTAESGSVRWAAEHGRAGVPGRGVPREGHGDTRHLRRRGTHDGEANRQARAGDAGEDHHERRGAPEAHDRARGPIT